jgi:predicted hotdog family 3-hydroxylacyl-ACP dehydratase
MTTDLPDWAAFIPHQGAMRLIDAVIESNADGIRCAADPRRRGHALARDGLVSAIHTIEYAAQAAALHQALSQPPEEPARPGWLLQVRNGVFGVDRLDTLEEPLTIEAIRFIGGSDLVRYRYAVSSGTIVVGSGELSLMRGSR